MRYLIDRVCAGKPIDSRNASLYDEIVRDYPESAACADEASALIAKRLQASPLTSEERLYLMLHVNRISERASSHV